LDKLGVFPITYDLMALLQYRELLQEYIICTIGSFKEDVYLEEMEKRYKGITFSPDIEDLVGGSDAILLLENEGDFLLKKYKQVYKASIKQQKKILLSTKMFSELQEGQENDVRLLDRSRLTKIKSKLSEEYENSLPVIAVCGMGKHCSKFETTLLTLKVLKEAGYQVLVIGPNPLLPLVGGHILPEYLYSSHISLEEKIYRLSADLYQLQEEKSADLILIEIPGGVIPIGKWDNNHFSEIPLVISNALKIDMTILNTYIPNQREKDKIQFLKELLDYKYGMFLEVTCMARQRVEYDPSLKKCHYLYLDDTTYNNLYDRYCETDVVSLNRQEFAVKKIRKAISVLEENVEFI